MSATEQFEAHAEAFYRETGYMAPGKDRSAAMGGDDPELLRYALWLTWNKLRHERDKVATLTAENARLREDAERFADAIDAVSDLIDNSKGVYGLHLNGNIAPWGELRTGGRYEEWLLAFDAMSDTAPEQGRP